MKTNASRLRATPFVMASLLAAGLTTGLLSGCGGGEAGAPQPPVGSAPAADTTAPTVSIASDVSAPTASGPVTFTFVFSEDVGISFEATDVVVTGGTAGTFNRLGGTQATLVVQPTAGSAGTMTVSVAAGRFTDLAGNANTVSASASKAYKATQTLSFNSPGNLTIGGPIPALSASSSSGLPVTLVSTTTSVCTVTGTTLTLVAPGNCSIAATQDGNTTFAAASPVTQTFAVAAGQVTALTFSSGFASGSRTVEGGGIFTYSGSNLDGFNCNGGPAWCGSGQGGAGADSFYFAYYQTPSPATALYSGISILAPGVTSLNGSGDTPGVQLSGQSNLKFTFNNNPEWQASGTNNFGVLLTLGKYYNTGTAATPAACNLKLLAVVTPLNNGAQTAYEIPLSSFQVIQSCGTSIATPGAALSVAPVSEIAFQAAGGGAALPAVGGKTTGANRSVSANGVYPTTLALKGAITFGVTAAPTASVLDFSTGFASPSRTPEGGAVFSYSGSNLDGFNCTGGAAWCGNGQGGTGADSFFFAYYQTPTPANALYNGISVLAPGVISISSTADTAGVKVNGQTTLNFTFNNNPEWQASGTNNFGVLMTLGKYYNTGTAAAPAACNLKLLAVVTPQNNGNSTAYSIPLSSFQVIQSCGTTINTAAAALATSQVSEIAFQAAGGSAALPSVGGKTTGANLSVIANGVYPTTLAIKGGISFRP